MAPPRNPRPPPQAWRPHRGDGFFDLQVNGFAGVDFQQDDLGARDRVSDHAYETLKKVLDSREGRPLIALSNARLSELARVYDDRIASRLSAGTLIALDEPDQRLKKE